MREIIEDPRIDGIDSAYIQAPFDEAKMALENAGYDITSGEKNAKLRIIHGKEAHLSKNGNHVREGLLYVPNEGRFIIRESLVMAHPQEATKACRGGGLFYVTKDETERVLQDSILIPYNKKAIPTNRFNEDEIANFVFRKNAGEYGFFLKDGGVISINTKLDCEEYINLHPGPYADQLRLEGFYFNSDFSGSDASWGLSLVCVRGIRENIKNTTKNLKARVI